MLILINKKFYGDERIIYKKNKDKNYPLTEEERINYELFTVARTI